MQNRAFEMRIHADMEDAREEGRAEGREEGRAEGREEGRAEGEDELVALIFRLKKGETVQSILASGVSQKSIEKAQSVLRTID